MRKGILTVWLAGGAAWVLGGCQATVHLAQRRANYDAVLRIPAQVQAAFAEKTALFDGVLTRTSTPNAAPYPALRADVKAMAAEAAALQQIQPVGAAFEGDFDFFAVTHATVSPKQTQAWASYRTLDGRFPPLDQAIEAHQKSFNVAAEDFDALVLAADICGMDQADLDGVLDAFRTKVNLGLKHMEERVRLDRQAVTFDSATSEDPGLKEQKRAILESMEEHLFKTEDLVRRALVQADQVEASCPAGGWLWTGPGLPDDGSALAQLWRQRDSFDRRRVEFKSLAQSFDAVGRPGL